MTRHANFALAALVLLLLPASYGCNKANAPKPTDAKTGTTADDAPDMSDAKPTAIETAIAKLPEADRELVKKQGVCPVSDEELGSMGTPIKVTVDGKSLFICCEGCEEKAKANFAEYIAKFEDKTAEEAQN